MNEKIVTDYAASLLAKAEASMIAMNRPEWTTTQLTAGSVVDEWGRGGQLYVSLQRMYPSMNFPQPLVAQAIAPQRNNLPVLCVDLDLGMIRKWPVSGNDRPTAKNVADQWDATVDAAADGLALWNAVLNFGQALDDEDQQLAMRDAGFLGPYADGLLVEYHLTLGLIDNPCGLMAL